MEDKRKALYDALAGEYDLGTYEDFTAKLNDESKRKALYDAAAQDYNLGTYEEYSEKLGFGPSDSNVVPMFDDEPQATPAQDNVEENSRKLRGLWANFKESSKGLWAGIKGYAGEQLNMFTGSSREEQAALNDIERLEEQGVDVIQYIADKEDAEFQESYGMSKDEFMALDKKERKKLVRQASKIVLDPQTMMSDAELKEQRRQQTNQQAVEDAFYKALEMAGGDLTKAKAILREQATDKTKGDILIEEATETMNNLRQPEGFAGWVGNLLPQMVPSAVSIALNYMTKGKASGLSKALGYGTMGGLTLSTAGMSMLEARNAGATNLEVWTTGIADGAIEIISEKIPFDRVTKRVFSSAKANVAEKLGDAVLTPKGRKELEKLLSNANEKLGGKLFSKKNVGEWLTDTAYEAAGEFTAEALQTITTMIYENPEDYPTISEVLANGWEGAKAGLFMGSVTGGASLAASHAMNKDRRQTQGYVDVAQMENENGEVEVVEVVGEDPQTGNITILHGDAVEEVSQDKLGDRFRFSYEEFENGRLRSREDDAIDNGVVNDGQIRGMEETIQRDLKELQNFFTAEEINQIASGTIPANASAEGVAAARRYMDDVQRIDDLHAAKAEQDQKRKDACRDRIESEVGQRFWVQEEGEDGGSGVVPVTETVEEVVYADGRVGYVVGSDEAGNLTMVYNDGSRGFSTRAEIAEKENSGEILSNTVMGLDDYLAVKVDIEDVTAEAARMKEEQTANVQSVQTAHPVGSTINVGTAEAKVEVPIIAVNADGAIVQMPDGTTPQLTWADIAHAEGQEVKPKTNAELDQEVVDEYKVAYQPAVKTGQEPSFTEREVEVEQTTPANPLPLKADGSVDQTALWNNDPERWAQWNDEQRQDGGANSLAYVSGAIAKEQAKIAELQAAYAAESDFDARDAIEKEIADTQVRVERLTAIQQGYVAQAEAAAAPIVEAEPVAPRISSQVGEQVDEQYDGILRQTRIKEERVRILQEYLDKISEGSLQAFVLTSDNYADVMRREGCSEGVIAVVGMHLEAGENIGGFTSGGKLFLMEDGLPSIEEARITYIHERQHVFNTKNPAFVKAVASIADKQMLLSWLSTFVGPRGLNPYKSLSAEQLADEVVARCMEIAYTTKEFSVDLQSRGIPSEIISIITDIDNEQRKDQNLLNSRRGTRRDTYADVSGTGSLREDGRNIEQVSGGVLEQETTRPSIISEERVGSRSTGEGAEVISEEQLNAPNSGTAQQIAAADGEVLADTDGKGGVRFSIRTWNEGGRDYLAAWLANDTTLTEEEKADILARMDEFYKNALLYSDTYAPFGTWSDAGVRYDNNGNPLLSVIKANGDYAMNLDFSLVCKKRRPLNRLLRTLVNRNAFATYTLRERELAEINWILQEHGFEVACALCFVDSKRYRVTGVADVFAALYNRLVKSLAPEGVQIAHFNYNENPNVEVVENGLDTMPDDQLNWDRFDRMLSAYKSGSVEHKVAQYLREHPEARKLVDATDFIEAEGFESVKENNPDLLKFYNMKKGTGGPKASFGDVQYLNDILKKEKSFDAEKAYAVGGVRLQSFSDFVPHMYFDYMQLFAELAAKKLPLHAYTKEVLFAKIFGLTGAKINMSLVPAVVEGGIAPGLDAEGNYAWADPVTDAEGNVIQQGQSFPYDEAMAIQQAEGYSKNCGVIAVGISDAHIEKMLDDPNIPFIIPYHKSSLNAIVARMTNIDQYKDYTNVQNTRKASGSKLDKGTKDFNFNEYLHGLGESGTPQQAAQAYLDWCRENNYKPKFSQFAYHPNYYKLLQDFNTIDLTTGEYAPQGAVTMTFPTEESAFGNVETLIQQGLQEDTELEEKMEQEIDAIADQVLARLDEISKEPKMSEKQQAKKMAELADERTAKIKAKAKGPIDLIEEAKKSVENDVMFRFIGEQAAINFDRAQQSYELMNNLEVAREMLQQDVDARKIKAATGWEMGADGRWRLERPDFEFKAKPGKKKTFKLSELIEDASLFAEYPQLKNIKVRYKKLPSRLAGEVTQENGEDIILINEENYRAYNPTYEQAIDEFTKMYPEIAKLIYSGNAGRLTAEQRKIFMDMMGPVLALESPYIEEMGGRNTLAHEIQHLIQKYEGFAEGGSEDMTDTTDPNDAKRVQELRRMLSVEIDIVNDMVGDLNDMLRRGRAFEAAGNRESSIALKTVFDKKKREYQVHMDNVNYLKKELRKFKTLGAEGYKKLAGEVEARNVEKRLNMTAEERRQSLYSDTQDVATEDQIFLRNNLMTTYASETLVPAIRFRVTAEQDKAYMDAVEAGDMKTAQRMVLEAAKLAMPNTKVMDKKGNPTVVYHGTKGKFNTFAYSREDIGFHFGTKGTARTRIGRGKDAHIMQVFLNIENPLIFDTDLGSWDADYIVKDLLKKEMMSYDDAKAILLTPNGYKRNSVSALVDLRQWMSNNGYDGIVYPNWYESDGKDSYIAFSRSQIKSADPVAYDDNGNVIPLSERFNPENADIRFRFTPRTDEQREQLFDKAREQYGVTNNFNASGYMLPDGSLLDFSEANDGGDPNRRSLDHRDIEGLIMDEGKEYDSRYKYVVDFVAEGAIRMLPEAAGFQLSVPPTAEQRSRLMDYIYKYDGEVIMEITDENGGPRVYMEYNKRTSPSRIFRDMDGFFNEGIVPGIPPLRFRIANNNQAIFVSNAARAVEGIKQEKATPEQWLKMIEKNGGLKAGEDKWMGLSDFLKASDKKTLTKQEVLDFINENMIIIEETHYAADAEDDAASRHDLLEQRVNERYKEILNSLQDIEDYDERRFKAFNMLQEELGEFADNVDLERYGVYLTFPYEDLADYIEFADMFGVDIKLDNPIHDTRLAYTTPGLVNHHEIALTVPTIEPWNKHDDLHFGDAGNGRAVAWVRFGETWERRPSPQISRKVLVIDEVQSKRHQEGREKGYIDQARLDEIERRKAEIDRQLKTIAPAVLAGDRAAKRHENLLYKEIGELRSEGYALTKDRVPDAPFDKNWHELAMKRMLRYAAENGYDAIAWTTGDQQADRYDLSRDVKKISASRQSKDGERIVNIYYRDEYNDYKNLVVDREGKVIYGDFFGSTLADVIGKEMALQIMSSEESTEFKGEGLKIGGEGMRGFYDKMLPAFMNKYGKKWGVKVEDIDLPNLGKSGRTMHSVPVTEEMKASVMEGQVMFRTTAITQEVQDEMDAISATAIVRGNYLKAPNGADTNLTPEQWAMVRTEGFKFWFGDWEKDPENASKVVDENGEPMVVYHGTQSKFTAFDVGYKGKNFGFRLSEGFYFSPDETVAESYASFPDELKTGEVKAVFLNIINPFYIKSAKDYREQIKEIASLAARGNRYQADLVAGMSESELLSQRGYDGVFEKRTDKITGEIVVFEPNQIKSASDNTGVFSVYDDIRFRVADSESKREIINNTEPVDVIKGAIVATDGQSVSKAALRWFEENVGKELTYNTEVGTVTINRRSVKNSLAHGYSQTKLDAITSLPEGFGRAVYLASEDDFDGKPEVNHYFVYPINYDGSIHYVLCRVKSDVNKSSLYIHEVFPIDAIKGHTLQTAADQSQPHRGISLYLDLLKEVLYGKDTDNLETTNDSAKNIAYTVNENPTEAQKEAGNYKMGHLNLDGYRITIEIPKGSVRRGTDSKGNAWENTLNNDYGYIRGTEGVDGDHIDVYLSDNPTEGNVFVIDQVNPETREFDEHKVMYGFNSAEEAREAYLANFSEGWNGLGTITEVSKGEFKKWIESSHRKTKPFSEYKSVKTIEVQSEGEDMEDNLLPSTGIPTDEVVTNGLQLTPAQTAEVAANIFAALPEESRKKITEGLNGNVLGLKDAILQIPASLASKENWNDEDKQIADVVAEEMTKMAGEMTRPFSAEEGLWLLYNNLNKGTDLISQASRALVQRNLGFDAETLAKQEQAKEDVRFRTVGDATSNAQASLYNRGAVNVWTRLKESFVDMQASVEELVKAIEERTGKVAQGFENILLALNQQSSKGLAAMESYTQRFLNPMFDEIRRIMNETKMKYEDVVRYVILKHGLERNKKLAQRDARAHYQEIYDDIISKITGMTAAQKRTYLTNAQLKEGDAKAELATLQAVDMSAMTNEEKKEHKKKLAAARKAVEEAEEYLKRAQKIASMSEQEAQDELDKIFEKIENGTDSVLKEMRENDYSGISSMFYDQLGVDRKNFSTEEQYQAALMEAKKDRYSSLKDVEAAAEAEVKSFEGKTDTKELWKRINAATKETLRQQYEANMISKDQYLNLRDMFEYYVPLRGFKENTAEDMYTYYRKPNSTGYTKPILGAEGRKTEAESPFGWIAAMAGSAIASNVKNEAKLALFYFVSNRPENGIATISKTWFVDSGEVDERGKKIFKPAYPPFSEDLSSDAAKANYEAWQENMRELQKKGQAYEAGQRLNLGNAVVNISDANKPEHIVNVKVGGKDYTIIINGNPRAAQAINGDLNIEGTSQDYSALFGPVLRWMSSVNTSYNPEFWITNMMRDMAFTWMAVNIKEDPAYRRKFSKNYRKAFRVVSLVAKNEKGTIGDSYLEQQYKDFVKYGGVTGYTQIKDSETWEQEIENYLSSNDPESVKNGKVMRGMKSAFHAAHRFGESLEQVSRFAAFLTARETGKSINEAINDAKEITVNFNRKGSGKMITLEEAKYLTGKNGQPLTKPQQWMVVGLSSIAPLGRRFIMFFNAAIQGLNATYKLMKKNPKRFTGWALGYAAVGMMNAVLHAMLDDDDDYLDIPQYERRNSLMIGGNGAYFKWALPQEARAFYALGDLAVETVMGRNPHQNFLGEALKIGTEILPVNPSEGWKAFMPSVAIPFIELALNEDYKGAPIYNEQKWLSEEEKERTAKWSNAYQGTGWTYVKIAQGLNFITGGDKHDAGWINLQPEKLEHLVQSAFGGTIRTADKFINTISAALDPEEPMTIRQTPFLNRFLTINDERFKNVHVNDVFDYYKADAEHALTLEKQYIKDRDMDSLTELRSSDEYQWAKIYGKYKKPLKAIQDKIKVADGTAEKKELMKQQDELKKRMIKEISEL